MRCKYDRARVQLGKISRFGLMELSRQRLRPALAESAHIPCPRCHGIGHIRGTESTALHILRIIQEEAMKDNTAQVVAQVPVDVATFLLNEKRTDVLTIETRFKVNVLLVPNRHLETPNYSVERLRHDDLNQGEPLPLSFDMVQAARAGRPRAARRRKKPRRAAPGSHGQGHHAGAARAGAGGTPAAAAPAPAAAKASWFSRMMSWFSAKPEAPAARRPGAPRKRVATTVRVTSRRRRARRRRRDRKRGDGRNRRDDGRREVARATRGGEARDGNAGESRNRRDGRGASATTRANSAREPRGDSKRPADRRARPAPQQRDGKPQGEDRRDGTVRRANPREGQEAAARAAWRSRAGRRYREPDRSRSGVTAAGRAGWRGARRQSPSSRPSRSWRRSSGSAGRHQAMAGAPSA